jgi:TusA-related sulfurtransferase
MSEDITVHAEVDAIGLTCPLPILRAKKALATMKSGEVLRVFATDPGSVKDQPLPCRRATSYWAASRTMQQSSSFY